ncbi:MAG: 5-oxoprolinase (ATP-hydrolyzing) [Polyangiales bacterium]|jgi:5-oxoprolinase (ATP-hydrolysing)
MGWQFWIDRGGTFTDVVARCPDGTTLTHKLLSENPRQYADAAIAAIRAILGILDDEPIPFEEIDAVKMGTTVATNALLERTGARTAFVTTQGFGDALRIGYQARPDIFALDIVLPEMMYAAVVEAQERIGAHGEVLLALDVAALRPKLEALREDGFVSVAICLMHGYRYPAHEQAIGALAEELGFEQVSMSHVVSPLMKLVSRGDTTVVDAYLSPVLRRYVRQVEAALQPAGASQTGPRLMFMQSSGGLCDARSFQGKDALLSGPAGGVVGMVRTATAAGLTKLLGFDMGGTSTDVSHYAGELERTYETQVAGVRVRAPMIHIHTVAAGGGSLLRFDGHRLRVGPESAGANPGPAAYRNDGPLCVTDCNVLLGKVRPEYFPSVFGSAGDEPLDAAVVRRKFDLLAAEVSSRTGVAQSAEALAEGFLTVAVENMANAIKKISVQRGYDVSQYALVCFGGAGGQHACLVADRLGVSKIYIHPQAGVLSALGIGLADVRDVRDAAVDAALDEALLASLATSWEALESASRDVVRGQGVEVSRITRRVALRYAGSDLAIHVGDGSVHELTARFEETHKARFGFISPEKSLVVESLQVEAIGESETSAGAARDHFPVHESTSHEATMAGRSAPAPFVDRRSLPEGESLAGPAVLLEATATTVVEPGWKATALSGGELLLERETALPSHVALGTSVDPVQLEIFNMLFMNIAEQMGVVLENTAASVNIKERLDFSCAVFDAGGELVANAPHMPVHLGSMSESIKSVMRDCEMKPGSVFMMNAPYNGGTHLPDITVIKPVFLSGGDAPVFFVASRGHHADIGGTAAGSAPADSTHVDEEGVLIDNVLLVEDERFLLAETTTLLTEARYPARNPQQNIADLKAQVAACERGSAELLRVIDYYGLDVVHAYMGHVKDNAEECVRQVIDALTGGEFVCEMDDGHSVKVAITVDHETRSATIDFRGTSGTHPGNYNAPSAIAHAAVLYVFRCLVDDDIPLNAGCMKPLRLLLPPGSMIDPRYPAAVIAGNVETSQVIVDALFGALGVMGAAQGTMNNFFWGNETHQYYETICGGAGATPRADGCSAVQTHMTNSRLTDPEVLEWRFPVVLEEFSLRTGSGGEGRHRGGEGVVRRIRFEEAMEVNVLSGHRRVPPYGMAGGRPGAVGHSRKIARDGIVTEFPASAKTQIEPGERFEIETPGGGGFGKPE